MLQGWSRLHLGELAEGLDEIRRSVLALETAGDGSKAAVTWVTRKSDEEVRYHRAPEAGFWRRLGARIYALLPIGGQL